MNVLITSNANENIECHSEKSIVNFIFCIGVRPRDTNETWQIVKSGGMQYNTLVKDYWNVLNVTPRNSLLEYLNTNVYKSISSDSFDFQSAFISWLRSMSLIINSETFCQIAERETHIRIDFTLGEPSVLKTDWSLLVCST